METTQHVGAWLREDGKPGTDTIKRVIKRKQAMSRITRAWRKGARGFKGGVKDKLSRMTRIRVMREAVVPTLTAFCKTRAWTTRDLEQLALVERKALSIAFGVTMKDVKEHRIKHEKLYKAACWQPIDQVIERETLKWIGHVARMGKDRLPKTAMFGWRKGIDPKIGGRFDQVTWIKKVLKEAKIPEMDWFRAAQSKGPGGQWMWMIDRAFPKDKITAWHRKRVNEFKVGYDCSERLPMPAKKRRRGRWPYKLNRQRWECPVCEVVEENGSNLEKHYLDKHAVFDPEITTHKPVTCKHCGMYVRTKDKLGEHREKECRAWKSREKREGEGGDGWMPTEDLEVGTAPERWFMYTDGSGPSSTQTWGGNKSEGAGWGAGIFKRDQAGQEHGEESEEPWAKLSGPVITDKTSHLYVGAEEATNNMGEIAALIEGMIWLETDLKDGERVPVTIKYDSEYAAGMTRGKLTPDSSKALVQKAKKTLQSLEEKRQVDWVWVKGHSGENGNWWADKLADEGKNGEIGKHNIRWAAPPPPVNKSKQDWMKEKCRKCGKDFHLDGRRCAAHEAECTGTGVAGMGYPGYIQCRKCGTLTGTGVEKQQVLREARNGHEAVCLGSQEANKKCRGCGETAGEEATDSVTWRRLHETKCKVFRSLGAGQEEMVWTCQCGQGFGSRNLERNEARHLAKCKGDSLLNRTCVCGFVQDESLPFVHWRHLKECEEARRAGIS